MFPETVVASAAHPQSLVGLRSASPMQSERIPPLMNDQDQCNRVREPSALNALPANAARVGVARVALDMRKMTVPARYRALCTSAAVTLLVMLPACITQQAGNTALIQAAWDGDSSKVQALLQAGADVNASNREGLTALMASTSGGRGTGDAGIAKALIAKGADVNAANIYGRTALMEVARNGNLEFVNLLLAHGANVNAKPTGGVTALMQAALNGHTAIVGALLEYGADPNASDEQGHTALIWAAGKGHVESVRMLLAHHANVDAKDSRGETALVWAMKAKKTEVVRLLREAGSRE